MPQFGESITEAMIVRWLKNVGDEVKEQEPLLELETEKSVFTYESPYRGKILEFLQGESRQVAVGTSIARFEVSEADGKRYLSMGIGQSLEGLASPSPSLSYRRAEGPPLAKSDGASPSTPAVSLSPMIRALAKEKGIPVEEVLKIEGTGPRGSITKEDFLKYLEGRSAGGARPEGLRKIAPVPVTPVRARIAEKMSLSKREIPHAGTGVDVDVTPIDEWLTRQGKRLGFLPFVLFSTPPSLKKFPILNSSARGKGGLLESIEQHDAIHLGVATATSQGLLVPVIKDADRLGFLALSEEVTRLIEKARAGRLEVAELTGATFTVNNTGALGAVRSQQIIPPPQAGILAVNRVTKRPWVVENEIKIRSILSLDLAFDHRLVDGDAACGFLMDLKDRLEKFNFSQVK